jgi:hypothetical protein
MAMGTRKKRERQQDRWIAADEIMQVSGIAFYDRLNDILDKHHFDRRTKHLCRKFYKRSPYGRPTMTPGAYFRSLLIGYFEGLDSERGIAWRTKPSTWWIGAAERCWHGRCNPPTTATRPRFTRLCKKHERLLARAMSGE